MTKTFESDSYKKCTWQISENTQSVTTNKTNGQIKLRISPREIFDICQPE